MTFNQIILVGNLGKDPETRYTNSGAAVCDFSIAVNTRGRSGDTETEWFSVICWERLAETVSQYLNKGSKALVVGRLRSRRWTANDGHERFSNEVIASTVRFLDSRTGDQPYESGQEKDSTPTETRSNDQRQQPQEVEDLPW